MATHVFPWKYKVYLESNKYILKSIHDLHKCNSLTITLVKNMKWYYIWWRVHYDLFRTRNSKFRTWDVLVLPVLIWDLLVTWGLRLETYLWLVKQLLGPTSATHCNIPWSCIVLTIECCRILQYLTSIYSAQSSPHIPIGGTHKWETYMPSIDHILCSLQVIEKRRSSELSVKTLVHKPPLLCQR